MNWSLLLLLFASLLHRAPAPVPCELNVFVTVEVGGIARALTLTQPREHEEFEERFCQIANPKYMGVIILGCDDGELNQTAEGCEPRECPTYDALAVTVGDKTQGISPLRTIPAMETERRYCRIVNPHYRGQMTLYCDYGTLEMDTSECISMWDKMDAADWRGRSKHAAVGLSDGAILVAGGLADDGPVRELWQWTPDEENLTGVWEQPWVRPVPPWTARFGAALAWRKTSTGEQVTLFGGNDGRNRGDVWRWTRESSLVDLPMSASDATGSQAEHCSFDLNKRVWRCGATRGVSGRRWTVPYENWPATEVLLEFKYGEMSGQTNETEGPAAQIAVELDTCRQVFELRAGQWSAYGCTGSDPPWVDKHVPIRLGTGEEEWHVDGWNLARLVIDREAQEIRLFVNGVLLLPQDPALEGQHGVLVGGGCRLLPNLNGALPEGACEFKQHVELDLMDLKMIDAAAWPDSALELRRLTLRSPPGSWQRLLDDAPWPARSAHAVVSLPDGGYLLMGGLSAEGLLRDVWRWVPRSCTLLEMDPAVAARYELECTYECVDSPSFGQWIRLRDAPWAPRQEHQALWTSIGLLMIGGRTDDSFESDVWRWTYSGPFCSLTWQGHWELLTEVGGFPRRHGHSLVGFPGHHGDAPETVIMIAGFGGEPEPRRVQREPLKYPVLSRGDVWCSNRQLGNFSIWKELAPSSPFSARAQSTAVAAPTLGTYGMLFFGGYDENARLKNDVWRWIGENATAACKVEDE